MEGNIVKDFKNLRVFTHENFIRMDELVQDLTTALEETATRPGASQAEGASAAANTYPRRYMKKRRGIRRATTNNYYWKRGTISEASESSVEEQPIRDYAGNVIHSDSDDLVACHRIAKFTVPVVDPVPPVESDSFTENLSPMRPQRRRRKYKTMTVDSSPLTDHIPSDADSVSGDKLVARQSKEGSPSSTMERQSFSGPRSSSSTSNTPHSVTAGKRKRSSKSRTDFSGCPPYPPPSETATVVTSCDRMEVASVSQESSLSSSEFDSDINANNEDAREADDEQSDFFHEPGPACGIPDIVPWWENERVTDEPLRIDSDFEKILTGTFAHLPKFSNQSFKARMGRLMSGTGREIRLGRRKLKGKMPRYTVGKFLQDRETWNRMQGHHTSQPMCAPGTSNSTSNNNGYGDIKRRRHVTRSTTAAVDSISGQMSDPVSETNLPPKVHRPGSGSCSKTSPVATLRRSSRNKPGAAYTNVSDS